MRRIIAHKLKWNDEGVASTVGTIMALLVFLAFLSMIVNQYVPVWMKDTEASHMNVAFGQFGELKGSIDMQVLGARMSELANQQYIPFTKFSPITLGVDGVPIFSAPSLGELAANQNAGPWNLWFQYYPSKFSTNSQLVNDTASGAITLQVFNRYFVQQTLAYENGAVIKWQYDGTVIRAEPTFELKVVNNTEEITLSLISLLGSGSLQGTTTEGILTKVIAVDTDEYYRVYTDVYVNHTSKFGLAWYAFYNATLHRAFGIPAEAYGSGCGSDYCYTITRDPITGRIITQMIRSPYFKITVQFSQTTQQYTLTLQLKNDYNNNIPKTMPIKVLRVQKSIVNIAVGGLGSQVNI